MSFMARPIHRIVVHHSAVPDTVGPAQIAAAHHDRGFDDIGYHYLIQPDGLIVMGRPEAIVGAHALGANDDSIGICLLGDFSSVHPTSHQSHGLSLLLDRCKRRYDIPNEHIYGHCEVPQRDGSTRTTGCPGEQLLAVLRDLRLGHIEACPTPRPFGMPTLTFEHFDASLVHLSVILDWNDTATWLKRRPIDQWRDLELRIVRVSDGAVLFQGYPSDLGRTQGEVSLTWRIPPEAFHGTSLITVSLKGSKDNRDRIVLIHEHDGPLSSGMRVPADPFRCSVRSGVCLARDETLRHWTRLRRYGRTSWLRSGQVRPNRLRVRVFRGVASNELVRESTTELPAEMLHTKDEFVELRIRADELPTGVLTFIADFELDGSTGSDEFGVSSDPVSVTLPDRSLWLSSISALERLEM
jgi:hypothetical protein